MAQINIPMGGRSVPIDVPDFAMESTQEQLLATLQQLVGGQSAATAKATSSIRTEEQTKKEIQNLSQKLNKDHREKMMADVRNAKEMATSVGRQAIKAAQGGNEGFEGMLRNAGLGMIATQFGMVAGYAEEMGNALSYGGRIGLTFGQNMIETSKDLAEIGLSITDLASTVGGSLPAIREFGNSVESGSQRFIKTTLALRQASEEFGNFGMNSVEMAQYLADELEMRRRVMTAEEMRLMTEEELVGAMKENLVQQERMAQVTGQDVQQRIQAQMSARTSQMGSMFLSGADNAQRASFNASAANLSMFGDLREQFVTALGYMLDGNEAFAIRAIGQENISAMPGLIDLLRQQAAMIQSGASAEDIDQAFFDRLMALRGEAVGGGGKDTRLEELAAIRPETFGALLELFRQMVEINPANMEELRKQAAERQEQIGDQRGLTAAQEAAFMEGKNLVNQFIVGMMGGASNDVVDAYRGFIDAMNKGFSDPNTQQTIAALGEAFGKIGIQPWASVIAGDANWSEKMSVTGDFMQAIGASASIVAGLKASQGFVAFKGLIEDIKELPALSTVNMQQPIDFGDIKDATNNALRVVIKNFDDFVNYINPPNNNNTDPQPNTQDQE